MQCCKRTLEYQLHDANNLRQSGGRQRERCQPKCADHCSAGHIKSEQISAGAAGCKHWEVQRMTMHECAASLSRSKSCIAGSRFRAAA